MSYNENLTISAVAFAIELFQKWGGIVTIINKATLIGNGKVSNTSQNYQNLEDVFDDVFKWFAKILNT